MKLEGRRNVAITAPMYNEKLRGFSKTATVLKTI